eukprot:8260241-Alexandrium_andersonii.AAC.1
MPHTQAALLAATRPSSPETTRSASRARAMSGGGPWTSVPSWRATVRRGKAASRRRAVAGRCSTTSHPHARVSVRRPAAWPAASRNHWKAADCQGPRAWPERSSTKVGTRTRKAQRA